MAAPIPQRRHRRPGFTLVELLIVMGIIVLLMGVLLPAVMHAMKTGRKSRLQADMHTIDMALEAYKSDFGDYPNFPSNISSPSGQWDLYSQRGAELLCRALIGPGPGVLKSRPSPDNSGEDGAGDPNNPILSGPGFRTRIGVDSTGAFVAQGKVWGPYLSPDKFRVLSLSTVPNVSTVFSSTQSTGSIDATAVLLDSENHVILYFPANTKSPTVNVANGFVINTQPTAGTPFSPIPLYNFYDNATVPSDPTGTMPFAPMSNTPSWFADFAAMLGADPSTGAVASGSSSSYTGPYLLWMAGDDGMYGLENKPNITGGTDFHGTGKSDDITNFDFPLNLRK